MARKKRTWPDKRKGYKLGKYLCFRCEKEVVAVKHDKLYGAVAPGCSECLIRLDEMRDEKGYGPYPWREVDVRGILTVEPRRARRPR